MSRPNPPGADDTIEDRISGGRVKAWFLLSANRWLVAGIVVASLFVGLVVLGVLDPVPLREALQENSLVATLFQALVTAVVTGVTIVVTINQLVISQELGAATDQRDRMSGALEFQREIESALDGPVGSPDPASFLQALVVESASRADHLDTSVDTDADRLDGEVTSFVDELRADAESVAPRLENVQFGGFDLVDVALDYDYSSKLYEARRLRQEYDESLSEEADDALDSIVATLELFGAAREHFKTLYFQWELVDLSRSVLYASVPALLVTCSMVIYVDDPGTITGTTAGVDNLVWVVSGAVVVALLPFAFLLSYILRIGTAAKRTLAMGPFVLRESDRGRWERE